MTYSATILKCCFSCVANFNFVLFILATMQNKCPYLVSFLKLNYVTADCSIKIFLQTSKQSWYFIS